MFGAALSCRGRFSMLQESQIRVHPDRVDTRSIPQGITEIGRAAMVVEGEKVPEDVLKAEEKAKDHAAPHVNFYDPSAYKVIFFLLVSDCLKKIVNKPRVKMNFFCSRTP